MPSAFSVVKMLPMNAIFRRGSKSICLSLLILFAATAQLSAQTTNDQPAADNNSTNDQIAALQLQLTNAWLQVDAIVCQPVPAFRRDPGYHVAVYSFWFDPGAPTPDFNRVDVRQSQDLHYLKYPWVSSDLTPNMMFRGADLEFNEMTKLFYTNRDLPKKKLTEAEMLQINSLYRTIGHCQSEIQRLQPPPPETASADSPDENDSNAPPKAIAAIERIPQPTRIRYGCIAIGTLLVLVVVARLIKKKPRSQ